jgi:hypothetical protein
MDGVNLRRSRSPAAARGWLADGALSDEGREAREAIEDATDLQMTNALDALGEDLDELIGLLSPWGATIREAGGYAGGPVDLRPTRDD